jgi:hypothetical protein
MVPRFLMDVSSLPLTSRGKIDRSALPRPEVSNSPGKSRNYERARNDIETKLVGIWEGLLEVSPIGVRDNFFALGGHSMIGFEMFERVKEAFGVSLPPVTLYRGAATVELLALALETQRAKDQAPAVTG